MAINRLLSRNEQRHFFNFLLDQLGDQLSCWFSAIIQYPPPASISSAERLPILLILTIEITNSYFKSLFIAQKDTHGESFFCLFGSIKKNSLKLLYGLMGLETTRGWNGNPERFDILG